jgi:hypothetical protein
MKREKKYPFLLHMYVCMLYVFEQRARKLQQQFWRFLSHSRIAWIIFYVLRWRINGVKLEHNSIENPKDGSLIYEDEWMKIADLSK